MRKLIQKLLTGIPMRICYFKNCILNEQANKSPELSVLMNEIKDNPDSSEVNKLIELL